MSGPDSHPHSLAEDAQGLVFGAVMTGFGAVILGASGLITGQLAGLALLIAQGTGWPFGPVYAVLSLPFYGFGYRRLGLGFVIRTVISVALLVAVTLALPHLVGFSHLSPVAAAVLAGMLSGAGLMALFRHRASLGGIGAVALDIQDRFGVRAGWVQMGFDAVLFTAAFVLMPWPLVLWSGLAALITNLVIAINYRRDRYLA